MPAGHDTPRLGRLGRLAVIVEAWVLWFPLQLTVGAAVGCNIYWGEEGPFPDGPVSGSLCGPGLTAGAFVLPVLVPVVGLLACVTGTLARKRAVIVAGIATSAGGALAYMFIGLAL